MTMADANRIVRTLWAAFFAGVTMDILLMKMKEHVTVGFKCFKNAWLEDHVYTESYYRTCVKAMNVLYQVCLIVHTKQRLMSA